MGRIADALDREMRKISTMREIEGKERKHKAKGIKRERIIKILSRKYRRRETENQKGLQGKRKNQEEM